MTDSNTKYSLPPFSGALEVVDGRVPLRLRLGVGPVSKDVRLLGREGLGQPQIGLGVPRQAEEL